MTNRTKALKLAAELGVAIDDEFMRGADYQVIEAAAPTGHSFMATFTHRVVASWFVPERGSKNEAWASLLEDLSQGVEPCEPGQENCRAEDCPRFEA